MLLTDHYTKKQKEYRLLTLPEILALNGHALITSNSGDVVRVKINGAVKTWKKDPTRYEIPVKFGLYEHARIENTNTINRFVIEI